MCRNSEMPCTDIGMVTWQHVQASRLARPRDGSGKDK